jgi:hypothetical protein
MTRATSLASKALARLETAAAAVHESETEKRRLQLVSSPGSLSALIRADGVTIEIQNGTSRRGRIAESPRPSRKARQALRPVSKLAQT